MGGQKKGKKEKKEVLKLRQDEEREIDAIVERLEVQDPGGETFEIFVTSLKDRFRNREFALAGLLDKISKNPSSAGIAAFKKLYESLKDPEARKIVRKAKYRLEQKGVVFEDREEEKVVRVGFGITNLGESPKAHLWRDKLFSYRILEMEFPPEGKEERVFIFCEENIDSYRLLVGCVTGSKRLVREIRDDLAGRARLCVPLPLEYAICAFDEYFEVYEDRLGIRCSLDFSNAKKFLAKLGACEEKAFFRNVLPEASIDEAMRDDARICAAAGPYDFHGMDIERCVGLFENVILSRLDYPKKVMAEVLEERIVEYFRSLDKWALGRYRMFLKDGVLEWLHRKEETVASHLYQIAGHVNYDGLPSIAPFLLKHLLSSIYYWTLWYKLVLSLELKDFRVDVLNLSDRAGDMLKIFEAIVTKGRSLFEKVVEEVSRLSDLPGVGWVMLGNKEVLKVWQGREDYNRLDSRLIIPG